MGPQHTPWKPTLHGGLAHPPTITGTRPLLAPHFLNPGFLALGVALAYGEKGGLQVRTPSRRPPPIPHPRASPFCGPTFLTGLLSFRLGLEQR